MYWNFSFIQFCFTINLTFSSHFKPVACSIFLTSYGFSRYYLFHSLYEFHSSQAFTIFSPLISLTIFTFSAYSQALPASLCKRPISLIYCKLSNAYLVDIFHIFKPKFDFSISWPSAIFHDVTITPNHQVTFP